MDFAQQIGAEAYISVNVGSGTPQEAADWLEYLTTQSADGPGEGTRRERTSGAVRHFVSRHRQ